MPSVRLNPLAGQLIFVSEFDALGMPTPALMIKPTLYIAGNAEADVTHNWKGFRGPKGTLAT